MSYEIVILILFLVASLAAIIVKKVHLPYTIALVGIGIVLGNLGLLHPPELTKDILYALFLPGLIFEAAIHLDSQAIRRDLWSITALVVPGVIVSTLVSAGVLVYAGELVSEIPSVPWSIALLFGAAVAATDPIAVTSVFKELGAPKRLRMLIESESLFNDGTGIVVFGIVLAFLAQDLTTPQTVVLEFVKVVGLGALIGLIVGGLSSWMIRELDDAMVVITMTTIAAYGSFLLADRFAVSGVIASVAAGWMIQRNVLQPSLYPSVRLSTEGFWEFMAFALNSLIFLMMGFSINFDKLLSWWPIILIAYAAMLLARFIVVSSVWGMLYPTHLKFPFSWAIAMSWGGLRGALSMVLALSLPDSLPYKEVVVTMVFGVVILSIFIQGLTIMPLARILGLISAKSELGDYERGRIDAMLFQTALDEIDNLKAHHIASKDILEQVREEYAKRKEEAVAEIEKSRPELDMIKNEETLRVKRRLINIQKNRLLEAYQKGEISRDVFERLSAELDASLLEIDNLEA